MTPKKIVLSQQRLKEVLEYNPETGVFKNIIPRTGSTGAGKVAGNNQHTMDRIRFSIDGNRYDGCRLVFLYMRGKFPDRAVYFLDDDHRNLKWDNLSEKIKQPTIKEIEKTGVTFNKVSFKFDAKIIHDDITTKVGNFHSKEAAEEALGKTLEIMGISV